MKYHNILQAEFLERPNRFIRETVRMGIHDIEKDKVAYSGAPNVTFTSTGKPVMPETVDERFARVGLLCDYRLEQVGSSSYRVQVLPEQGKDLRGLRGAVLDALEDIYGMQGDFDIDIILEDGELMPKVPDRLKRINYKNRT